MKRRGLLKALVGIGAVSGLGYWWLSRSWDGYLNNPCHSSLPEAIKQSELWQIIWDGIDTEQVWDLHAHTVGVGDTDSGIYVNPAMQSWFNPIQRLQYGFYKDAACLTEQGQLDTQFYKRLLTLVDQMPSGFKTMLLAFDYHYDDQAAINKELSTFYVPNDYPAKLAQEYSEHFEWIASIHPYRKDALDELDRAVEQGAMAVKWLPPAQNIDPLSKRCENFYTALAKYQLPLLCHAGTEEAVQGSNTQHLGNPLRLRRALDHGVKVVVAHSASLGEGIDLDQPEKGKLTNFDLFVRLMQEEQYQDNLFAEISATTQYNRDISVLKKLLSETSWHNRIVNGSDYPLPAVMPLISLKRLVRAEILDQKWLSELNQIRQYNGLLFDFAVKRLLNYRGIQFPASVFETRRIFDKKD